MKTIREEKVGKAIVRLLKTSDGYAGVVITSKPSVPIEGDDPDMLWKKLIAEVGRAHPSYFGYDGARARFLSYYPKAFLDARYIFDERNYKDAAVEKINAILPIEIAHAATGEHCAAAMRAIQATNLAFPIEKARIKEVLSGPGGPGFIRSAARFADGDLAIGLSGMLEAIQGKTQPSWPMLTYLPFFWRPQDHLFLKPMVTCDFAERVGHEFARAYQDGMKLSVYKSLLNLAAETEREIASLKPRDLIDIQSFIWVMGAYAEET